MFHTPFKTDLISLADFMRREKCSALFCQEASDQLHPTHAALRLLQYSPAGDFANFSSTFQTVVNL